MRAVVLYTTLALLADALIAVVLISPASSRLSPPDWLVSKLHRASVIQRQQNHPRGLC